MFVEKRRSWIATVALGGVALPHIWMRTLAVTAMSIAVTFAYREVPALHYSITTTPFVLIGLPLGIFLGFRNNTAYDRFWEGRKLWGSLVNTARSLTRQIVTLIEPQPEADEKAPEAIRAHEAAMVHMLIAYVHALRHHLRESDPFSTLERVLPEQEVARFRGEPNVPIAHPPANRRSDRRGPAQAWIHPLHVPSSSGRSTALTDIQGGCERIKSTPIPYSYTVLMHRIVADVLRAPAVRPRRDDRLGDAGRGAVHLLRALRARRDRRRNRAAIRPRPERSAAEQDLARHRG